MASGFLLLEISSTSLRIDTHAIIKVLSLQKMEILYPDLPDSEKDAFLMGLRNSCEELGLDRNYDVLQDIDLRHYDQAFLQLNEDARYIFITRYYGTSVKILAQEFEVSPSAITNCNKDILLAITHYVFKDRDCKYINNVNSSLNKRYEKFVVNNNIEGLIKQICDNYGLSENVQNNLARLYAAFPNTRAKIEIENFTSEELKNLFCIFVTELNLYDSTKELVRLIYPKAAEKFNPKESSIHNIIITAHTIMSMGIEEQIEG